jgi:hypothetical protein
MKRAPAKSTKSAAVAAPSTYDPGAFSKKFARLDAGLVKAGFPPNSPWWAEETERLFMALKRTDHRVIRRWVIRAGRRAGKSSTLCKLAVAWALWGAWAVPAGDIGVIAFISVSRDESAQRLRTIAAALRAIGVPFEQRGDELELIGRRRVLFKTFAATTDAVGFTAILIIGDEVARWESRDTAANPAREVFGSLMPTLATQPNGFAVLSSAPWGTDDYHAELFALGDTDHQLASFATTWQANPTITEAQTHELEPDDRVWAREFAAEPGSTLSAALDPIDVAACFGRGPIGKRVNAFLTIDQNSLRNDDFAYIGGFTTDEGEFVVCEIDGWSGEESRRLSMADIVRRIACRANEWGADAVHGDQREEASLRSLFAEHDVLFRSHAWTEQSKDAAVMFLRRLMRERKLLLVDHATMHRELLGMKARLMPSGRTHYATNGLDYASALVTLAHAVLAGAVMTGSDADGDDVRIIHCGVSDRGRGSEVPASLRRRAPVRERIRRTATGWEFH